MSCPNHIQARLARVARTRKCFTAIAVALATMSSPVLALEYIWRGGSGNWDDASQWTLLGVPGAGDSALLGGGSTFMNVAGSVGSLFINRGGLSGPGVLTAGSLNFERGGMGTPFGPFVTGSTTVSGNAIFNGALIQSIGPAYTLTLQSASTWTAGTGALNGSGAVVNAAGAVFGDQGAGAANAYRALRDNGGSYFGGVFVNQGTYVRTGLGLTRAYGFDNAGTVQVQSGTFELRDNAKSSGLIDVAAGAILNFYGAANVSGRIDNRGLVVFERGGATLTSTSRLDGAVRILDSAVFNEGTQLLQSLSLNSGGAQLNSSGSVITAALDFRRGTLGGTTNFYPVGSTTVTGTTVFDGTMGQGVGFGHTLTLLGSSRWTPGDGGIGSAVFGGAIVNAAGASFLDEGAGSNNASKQLHKDAAGGGGVFVNAGTYVRSGLGLTRAHGFDNAGTVQVQGGTFVLGDNAKSSGLIDVSTGAVLSFYGSATVSGRIDNRGMVVFERGGATLTSTSRLDGAVRILDSAVFNAGNHAMSSLTMSGGVVYGTGNISTTTLNFQGGTLGGGGAISVYPMGAARVTGETLFDGTRTQGVSWQQTLTLEGTSRWTAGDGAITSPVFGGVIVNSVGASFMDEGAGSTNASKQLRKDTAGGGGVFVNDGIYTRAGLGRTVAYGFSNRGLLSVESGVFEVDGGFSNTGNVQVATGATLRARDPNLVNRGLIGGFGTLQTREGFGVSGLVNVGTMDPGSAGSAGTLIVTGELFSQNAARLRIDLFGGGVGDKLAISGAAFWDGDLDVFAAPGASFALGETYVIASFAQRVNNSAFDRINWSGVDGSFFSVEYGAQSISLRVTAVPEPATWALALLSAPLLVVALRLRRQAGAA